MKLKLKCGRHDTESRHGNPYQCYKSFLMVVAVVVGCICNSDNLGCPKSRFLGKQIQKGIEIRTYR